MSGLFVPISQLGAGDLEQLTKNSIAKAVYLHKEKTARTVIFKNNGGVNLLPWTCPDCGKTLTRKSNKVHHDRTQFHKLYANMNKKLKNILIGDIPEPTAALKLPEVAPISCIQENEKDKDSEYFKKGLFDLIDTSEDEEEISME